MGRCLLSPQLLAPGAVRQLLLRAEQQEGQRYGHHPFYTVKIARGVN